jgi:hypothetical protein
MSAPEGAEKSRERPGDLLEVAPRFFPHAQREILSVFSDITRCN